MNIQAKKAQIDKLLELRTFLGNLKTSDEEMYDKPIADGKWSVKGIIAHLWLWDQYFLTEALEPIAGRKALTLQHLDYDQFNGDARAQAHDMNAAAVVANAIECRNRIIHCLESIAEEDYDQSFTDADGNKFVIAGYIDDFAEHDLHHTRQIGKALGGHS